MRKRFYLHLILSILLLGYFINPLFSQDSSTWYYGKKIRDIDFQGLKNVNESELSGVTANFIGEFLVSLVLSPAIVRIVEIVRKKFNLN